MDFKSLFADAQALVTEVEADPTKYAADFQAAASALKHAHDFVTALAAGDAPGARTVLTRWDDVDETAIKTNAVAIENAKSGTLEKLTSILDTVGKVVGAAATVARFVLPLL